MKIRKYLLCLAALILGASALAQADDYENKIDELISKTDYLNGIIKANSIDFASYDKWYKDFRKLSDSFENSFSKTHKNRKSYQAIREGLDGLSLAWGSLNQAQYAENEYKESATLNELEDAQKWKNVAITQRKKAIGEISQALESLRRSQIPLEREGEEKQDNSPTTVLDSSKSLDTDY